MITPKFDRDDLINVIESYPPQHPAHIAALKQMLDMLPEADRERFHKEAMEILGNPEPDGYDMNGQSVYRADTLSRSSGIPLADIENHCHEYDALFGKVEPGPKVTVLKQPEVEYQVSSIGVVLLVLREWTDGNSVVVPLLEGWFKLAI